MEVPCSLLLCIFSVFSVYSCCLGCVDEDRIALLGLKASSKLWSYTDPLPTWVDDNGSECCDWERVTCNNATNRRVGQLSLNSIYNWDGRRLPNGSLFLPFEELQYLDLSDNAFHDWHNNDGLERLSGLKKLEVLNLSSNFFNNSVLSTLTGLTSLKVLNLGQNLLGDSVSDFPHGFHVLSQLKELRVLKLDSNNFNNYILQSFDSLSSLTTLDLSGNLLEGSLSEFSRAFMKLRNLEELYLRDNRLSNFLPFHDLRNVSKLKILDLSKNSFSGKIPSSIQSMNSLWALSMHHNNLNDFVSGFCDLEWLRDLDVSENKLQGTIPSCLNKLTSLRMIDLSDNELDGHIPPFLLSNLKSLEYLSLSNNQFDGFPLFTSSQAKHNLQLRFLSLAQCKLNYSTINLFEFLRTQHDLRHIDLSHNNLIEKFPTWLVMNNTRLESLIVRDNALNGHIHFPHGSGANLKIIDISANEVQGELQRDIGRVLSKVQFLNLSNNHMVGEIPMWLGNMKDLQYLVLSNNNFSGEIPELFPIGCTRLEVLILSNNRLEGQIYPSLFKLANLDTLRLDNNQFSGYIPSSNISSFDLTTFDIGENQISGRIPSWIGNLAQLTTLVLGNNSFDGPIPLELCDLATIQILDISQNRFSGSIPSCLNLPSLKFLHFQGNEFTGQIPQSLLRSSDLLTLDLRHNKLSGEIPRWLNFLPNLRALLLKGNRFSGSIPRELCQLRMIMNLDLSDNTLSGTIPPCISNITFGDGVYVDRAYEERINGGSISITSSYTDLLENKVFNFLDFTTYIYKEEGIGFTTRYILKEEDIGFSTRYNNVYEIKFLIGMDLSSNQLTGEIPPGLVSLTKLEGLNMSRNRLSGSIPISISNLKWIESLDLSFNMLSGSIPEGLKALAYLSYLNFSYNNLSGRIPIGNQLQTLPSGSYDGNPLLCGYPLQIQCDNVSNSRPFPSQPPLQGQSNTVADSVAGWSELILLVISVVSYVMCLTS